MGGSGQNITNCILAAHKVRRHGADDKVGGCYPDGDENNEVNDSLCPSIFMWVRRGMKILFSQLLNRVPDYKPFRELANKQKYIHES